MSVSEPPKIQDLNKVIEPHLGGAGNKVVSYKSKYLTKLGDNYGSLMLSICVTVKRPNGEIIEMPLIAKLPPLTNDLYWQMFQPERTCITENSVYQYLAPELKLLQLEAGLAESELFDGFSRYYGSRISLDPKATRVDRDSVLILENLQVAGYKPGDRHKPYDLPHALLLMKYMAQFHALPIALRLQKKEIFEKWVRPFFKKFNIGANIDDKVNETMQEEIFKDVRAITNNNDNEVERVRKLFNIYMEFQAEIEVNDGPYTSIVHSDLWINNIMIKYDENDKPQKLKIVDFQIAQYDSIVHDIVFFLLTSVDNDVLESNYDLFLRTYYDEFVGCLQRLRINTSEYSFEGFLAEVKRLGHIQIPHALVMIKIIMADSSTLPEDFKDMDFSVLSKNTGMTGIKTKTGEILRLSKKCNILN